MKKRNPKYKWLRVILRILGTLLFLFLALVLLIRSPWGQDLIVSKIIAHISDKTDTKIQIDRLFITFSGNLSLEGVYLEDKRGDTLLYSNALEVDLGMGPLLTGEGLDLESVEWRGLKANIARESGSEKFNFDFLLEAFMPENSRQSQNPSESMTINIGMLDFHDFKIDYTDEYLGIESQIRLGRLVLNADKTEVEKLNFELDDFLLYDTEVVYKQTKPMVTEDSKTTPQPYLAIGNLELNNLKADYSSVPDSILASIDIGHFSLELPKLDLANNAIELGSLVLNNSDLYVQRPQGNEEDSHTDTPKSLDFNWPDLMVEADEIVLEDNVLEYKVGMSQTTRTTFDPKALKLSDIHLMARDLEYRPERAALQLHTFSFLEKSGFRLRNMTFNTELKNSSATLSDFALHTNTSSVTGHLGLKYQSIQNMLNAPGHARMDLDISKLNLALEDAFYFQSNWKGLEYAKKVARNAITGHLTAKGKLDSLQIEEMNLRWGKGTTVRANGVLQHPTQMDSLRFQLDTIQFLSTRTDVLQFVSEKDLGISVPEEISLEASAQGTTRKIIADAQLELPEGSVALVGNYYDQDEIQFKGQLEVDRLRLDTLLNNRHLGGVSLTMEVSGRGDNLNSLDVTIDSDFTQLEFRDYDFSNLELQAKLVKGKGDITVNFRDRNLNLRARTDIRLDSVASKFNLDLNVLGADLYALGLTKDDIRVGLQMRAEFLGNPKDYQFLGSIENGIAVYDNEQYQMGPIAFSSAIDSATTKILVQSDFLDAELQSNAAPKEIGNALTEQFKNYFKREKSTASVDSLNMEMEMTLRPNPILTEVFVRGMERLDSINLQANYNAMIKDLQVELHVPLVEYRGSSIDSLNVLIQGDSTNLGFSAGLGTLVSGPQNVKKTYVEGDLKDQKLLLDFLSFDGNEKVAHIASEMLLERDTIRLRLKPEALILNRREWSIPDDNEISIAKNLLTFKNVTLNRNGQKLWLGNHLEGVSKEHIGIRLENFRLQTMLSVLNPEEKLASGLVNGKIILENPFGATGLVADLDIDDFAILQNPLGKLSLDASSMGASSYDFNLALKEGGADLDVKGNYTADERGAKLDLGLDMNRIDLDVIQGFTQGNIKDSKGAISGSFTISGTTNAPKYNGILNFEASEFNVAKLNSVFRISDETLQIDSEGLYLENFEIADSEGSTLLLSGSVLTDTLWNPRFDLSLNTEKFKLLNATKEDNELFYGMASIDADAKIKGSLDLPIIDGRLRVRKVTDMTYVVPEAQLDVQERDGVVVFVNRENPEAILTRNNQEESTDFFQGMDVEAILEIAEDADFHIIIDERTGDNLQVAGDAELNLDIEPNGRINLTGRYELKSGHYETSLYNLVNRRFAIKSGSTITWQGDPMDAALDVTAVYSVETSAAPLMSSITSGPDVSIAGRYQQVLPFLVYLHVDGELLDPKLSFGIDMPEDEQGSIGGTVYARIQQLNQQEAELNKQVFSLLALNRFYPDSGSDGSVGGTAAIARDNVNKVLSGELNAFSDKIFGKSGLEVDFDLESFTDYQGEAPQDRTQLNVNASKKLFDDRLIVTAGSAVDVEGSARPNQEETPIIGNVSLEYLLTRDGRYRLRGFRKSEYENIIDGQLFVTGAALIFNREFNKFSQLFNPLKEQKIGQDNNPDEQNERNTEDKEVQEKE